MTRLSCAVEALLASTEQDLSRSDHAPVASTPGTVRDLLRAGEAGVAYEILCDNVHEIDVRPEASLVQELRAAVLQAGADPERVNLLVP
jgi:hypothetical protein